MLSIFIFLFLNLFMWMNLMIFKKKEFYSNFLFLLIFLMLFMNNFFCNWNMINLSMNLTFNYYSYGLVLMSIWIMSLVLFSLKSEKKMLLCINMLILMMLILMLNFLSMNILFFYFYFEFSLMLIFFIIMKWGLGNLRISASYYLMFYTLFFSLPLLLILIYSMKSLNSNQFIIMEMLMEKEKKMKKMFFLMLLMAFLVKMPMFMIHSWLLKAHVEAPVFGSMILAAIMLKLGSYGLLRLILIFNYNMIMINKFFIFFGILGSIIMSIMCFRQIDMKILVAMSSIVHMNFMMISMFTLFKLSILGCYLMMIAHGLCSSGLFYILNLFYLETNSRLMIINKGLLSSMSSMSLMWFLLCSSNMAAPFSLNLVAEILMLISILNWMKSLIYLLMIYCLLSFLYSLYLYSYINHGSNNFIYKFKSFKLINYLIILLHWIPLNFMIFNLNFLI